MDATLNLTQSKIRMNVRVAEIVLITGVLLLAALLRIYNITQQSIWFDEAFAWNIVIQGDMFPRIAADTHPPLYYVLLRGWVGVAGESALALRYLSALISLGTVAVVYQIGRELTHGRPDLRAVPVLAALVIALSDAEIFLAQETRNYSLYTLLAACGMWFYLRWLRQGRMGWAWALSIAALMYTHYQGAFIPFVQGLHALIFLRGRRRIQAIGWLALAGVLFAPWFIGVTVPQAQNAISNSLPFAIPSDWPTFLHLRDSYLGAQWALMAILMIAGVIVLVRLNWGRAFLIVLWVLVPFSVLFFGNYFASLLTERKLLIIAAPMAILAGFGLGRLNQPARALLVAAVILYGVTSVDYYREKEPWDRITAEVSPYAQADHLAMMEVGVGQYPIKYYWQRTLPEGTRISTFPFLGDYTMAPTTDWYTYYDALLPEILQETRQENTDPVTTAWLIHWSQTQEPIFRLEEVGYQRTMTITYDHLGNDINIYRYDVPPPEPITTFENGLTLHAAEIDATSLRVDLWWSGEGEMSADYTTSALLLDADGVLVAQLDSMPFFNQRPTTTWESDALVFDPKWLELAPSYEALPPGEYSVQIQTYLWSPEGITNIPAADGDPRVTIGTLRID